MNAKELLTALNDIDPKLLKDIDPWGTPAQKIRRPVWAVAAALILCLGLGTGTILLLGQTVHPETNVGVGTSSLSEGKDHLESVPDLEFTENTEELLGETTGYSSVEPGGRNLTKEELSQLREQPGLSWLKDYYLAAYVYFDDQGNVDFLQLAGCEPEKIDESAAFPFLGFPTFLLSLREGDLPPYAPVETFFLGDPNNQVNGTGVWAAVRRPDDQSVDGSLVESIYSVVFLLDKTEPIGMELNIYPDGKDMSDQDAELFAESVTGQALDQGISLEWLTPKDPSEDTDGTIFDPEKAILLAPENSSAQPDLEFAENTLEDLSPSDETNAFKKYWEKYYQENPISSDPSNYRELTEDEISQILDNAPLPWDDRIHLSGMITYTPEQEIDSIYLFGHISGTVEDNRGVLSVSLVPNGLPWGSAHSITTTILDEPNNEVDGVGVYAVKRTSEWVDTDFTDPDNPLRTTEEYTDYAAFFQLDGGVLGVSVETYKDPHNGGFSTDQETQDLIEQVVGFIISNYNQIDFSLLAP